MAMKLLPTELTSVKSALILNSCLRQESRPLYEKHGRPKPCHPYELSKETYLLLYLPFYIYKTCISRQCLSAMSCTILIIGFDFTKSTD